MTDAEIRAAYNARKESKRRLMTITADEKKAEGGGRKG
jgi:hypothetical protein